MNINKGHKKTILHNHISYFQAFLQTQNVPIAIPEVITIKLGLPREQTQALPLASMVKFTNFKASAYSVFNWSTVALFLIPNPNPIYSHALELQNDELHFSSIKNTKVIADLLIYWN